ncbi:hypothetical protein [Chakrabartyella piscis]|uniref:hypothetical protein n=1 Tax=Chakrabartyella piscis TaxID=2918914 RepID=UPI0029585DE7|nr:hypothetical protein [Chakrabartyella piscis]
MSFCSKCGREIMDESLGCPICSMMQEPVTEPVEEAEKVDAFTVEDTDGTSQRFERAEDEGFRKWDGGNAENHQDEFTAAKPVVEQTIPTVLKVIIIIAILLVGGIGQIAGLIAGVILLKSPVEDYRKFGKTLVVLSCVLLGFWFLCCIFGTMFNTAAVFGSSIIHRFY